VKPNFGKELLRRRRQQIHGPDVPFASHRQCGLSENTPRASALERWADGDRAEQRVLAVHFKRCASDDPSVLTSDNRGCPMVLEAVPGQLTLLQSTNG
jgi:hypothetical protein